MTCHICNHFIENVEYYKKLKIEVLKEKQVAKEIYIQSLGQIDGKIAMLDSLIEEEENKNKSVPISTAEAYDNE